jgi:hypothetical protein
MIRPYKILTRLGLAATVSLLASCSDLLDVAPRQSIDSATALNSEEALTAAINGVYDALQSTLLYGRDLVAIPEALADNGRATNKSGRLVQEQQNQPGFHLANWTQAYYGINQANLIIDAAPNVGGLAEATRNNIEGQAYFLRALMYFDLMKAYAYFPQAVIPEYNRGGVPLQLTGVLELPQVTNVSRATIEECYTQIFADLNQAITKLAATPVSRAPFYATQGAAQALASRVALYTGRWQEAAQFATSALASNVGRFQTTANYVSAWRVASHPESMFEINYQTNENIGVNTSLQTTYTTLVALGNRTQTGGFGDLVPTASLLADLDAEKGPTGTVLDVRRQLYELGTAGRGTAETEVTKFLGKNGTINLDNVPVIRISEMYLNRAEAYYQLGRTADALADLNTIRTRAGLPASPATLTGAALLTEILKQRRVELAFEGHRFWDLKRYGRDIVKAPATLPFNDFRVLARIPVNEISNNPNLRQNFGY